MLGSLVYRLNNACLKYAFVLSPRFGGFRLYIKPSDLKSALYAEGIVQEDYSSLISAFEEDFSYCRYRLDMDSSLKLSTTMTNTAFANEVASAIQGASSLAKREYSRKSVGEFKSIWNIAVEGRNITAHLAFKLGMISSGVIHTFSSGIPASNVQGVLTQSANPQPLMDIQFYEDGIDLPVIHSKTWAMENSLPLDAPEVFVVTPQLAILQRESDKPLFNNLNKDSKKLYSLRVHYSDFDERLKEGLPKRSGYYFFSISKSETGYPGADYLTAKVAKSDVNLGVYQTIEDVREAHPDKNTAWIEDCQYEIVTDATLPDIMKRLWAASVLSFDTETTGLKINFYSREGLADELVGVCISDKPKTGYYFPLQHKLFENLCSGDHHYFMQTYMKELLEKKSIVCHNLSFDWKVAYIYDINVNCVFDTILAFGVTKRYEHLNFPLGLKELCSLLFNIDMFEIEDFVISDWSKTNITFADLPYDLVKHYGPADADITLRVYLWCLSNKLLEQYSANRVFQLEVNFSKVVAYSEFWGYHIDIEQLPALEKDIQDGMAKEQAELFKIAGKEFNPNSSTQLAKIIYDELYPQLISSGIVAKRSTAKDILKDLRDNYRNPDDTCMYPFVEHLLEYRRYETTHKNFFKKKDLFVSEEGFVFPGVQQLGTNTGRISVKDPNYQSYNDVVKKRVTGRPGYYIFDCDFAQIEYRVLASMAGQDALITAFDDPDLDYHTHQAARMFSLPYAAVSKALRQQSKGINFGLPYGMGDESLGARVFGARTPENTAKAADLRKRFFAGQEKIQEFFDRVRNQGVRNSYTETWLGRRRYYHRDVFSEGAIRRQAGNHVIQGTAADIWKMAVTRLFNRVVKEGLLGKVFFNCFVHDELMGEVSVELNPYDFIKMWREEYELVIDKFCRLYAGFGWGSSWYEAKKADYPPQFIDTLVAKSGQGIPWDGDYKTLIKQTKKDLYDFETWRVKDWLQTVPEGTILAPHIGGYLYDKVGDWWEELQQTIPECGNYLLKKKKNSDKPVASLDQVISWFCQHEGIEFRPGWVVPPDAQSTTAAATQTVAQETDEDADLLAQYNQLVCQQVYDLGFYLDTTSMTLYIKYISDSQLNAFCSTVAETSESVGSSGFKLVAIAYDANGMATAYSLNYSVPMSNFNVAQEIIRTTFCSA